jgi:hypothetical protein
LLAAAGPSALRDDLPVEAQHLIVGVYFLKILL